MASLDDLLTAAKNIATAINSAAQTYANIQGVQTQANISTTTLVSAKAGRVAMLSITTGGAANGTIYDTNAANNLVRPIYTIPNTIGIVFVNLSVSYGIVVVPGSGQTISLSYS